jgi:hypothetical protein
MAECKPHRRIERETNAGTISRRRFAAGVAATALAAYLGSKIPKVYAQEQEAIQIPPAIVRPNIDGRYTPVEELEFTDIGKQTVEQNPELMPKNEWDDCIPRRYLPVIPKFEWYSSVKHDDKWLYMLIDAVSDTEVGERSSNRDTRQIVDFLFDTKNSGKDRPGAEGVYYISLYFVSPTQLRAGDHFDLVCPSCNVPVPGNLLPPSAVKHKWSISESPHSRTPHIMIETAFDLDILTKYYKDSQITRFHSMAKDINLTQGSFDANFNLLGEVPVPEGLDALTLAATPSIVAGGVYFSKRSKPITRRAFLGLRENRQ